MLKYLVAALTVTAAAALAQQPSAPASTSVSIDDLREAHAFCTKRYIEHEQERKKTAKWQQGFESCDKIVSAWEAAQHKWADTNLHKSRIDAIAGSK